MEDGRITERGTHEELIRRRGAYWKMAKHQLKLSDDDTGSGFRVPGFEQSTRNPVPETPNPS
jgi:hypothetical protein